jgi:hypothetical protein
MRAPVRRAPIAPAAFPCVRYDPDPVAVGVGFGPGHMQSSLRLGTVNIEERKTDDPRSWALGPVELMFVEKAGAAGAIRPLTTERA